MVRDAIQAAEAHFDAAAYANAKRRKKLQQQFYGPFKILEQTSPLSFRLELPEASNIHPVFHRERLKPHTEMPKGSRASKLPPSTGEQNTFCVEAALSSLTLLTLRSLYLVLCTSPGTIPSDASPPSASHGLLIMILHQDTMWENMFDPQTRLVLAALHASAAARAALRPYWLSRCLGGIAVAAAISPGGGMQGVAATLHAGMIVAPTVTAGVEGFARGFGFRSAAVVAAGLCYALACGYLCCPPAEPSRELTIIMRVATLADLRNSVAMLNCYSNLTHVQLPRGGHHVHMTEPAGVVAAINSWLAEEQASSTRKQ
eukprot:SAG22_NODE_422_length_10687_cov_4.448149_1_plen_316_part_00